MIFVFLMLSFKPAYTLSSFTFIKRLFSSSSLFFFFIRMGSSTYLRLLIFLLKNLILACASSSLTFSMMYSAYQRRQWHPTPVLLPGKSHGQRSLVGCSPWGHEESDMTERLHFHFSLLCIGEGNGNPLQCSCLENPRDGVAQSQTRLK